MRCAHCKANDVTISHVKECSGVFPKAHAPINRPIELPLSPVERLRAAAANLPNVEHAYYAVRTLDFEQPHRGGWNFYRVDKPQTGKWRGYTFVKRQASDDFWPVKFNEALNIVEAIATDPQAALSEYGHQIGRCGICHRTLTDPESIALGIGPICAGRIAA